MSRTLFAALVGGLIAATPVAAQPVALKLNSPAPPPSFLHGNVFQPWIDQVTEASNGTLQIELLTGGTLGGFAVNYDRVVDGVADIGFILTSFTGGKFKKLDVAELPFESKNSTEASVALWKVFESGIADDEFDQVIPLAIWTFPNAALHTNEVIETKEDVEGLKFGASNVITSRVIEQLGGTPITLRPDETYQAISRSTVNGTIMPFTGMAIFKIDEVTDNHLDAALGASTALLFMNREKYESLPDEAKAAIDQFSYESLSEKAGMAADANWEQSRGKVGDAVNTLSEEEEKRWAELMTPLVQHYVGATPDGQQVLDTFREAIAAYREQGGMMAK
jgi:TRAP-type C4-dicarboxylate transport system substrate-binding protein